MDPAKLAPARDEILFLARLTEGNETAPVLIWLAKPVDEKLLQDGSDTSQKAVFTSQQNNRFEKRNLRTIRSKRSITLDKVERHAGERCKLIFVQVQNPAHTNANADASVNDYAL
jgi:hypothetical protein